MDLILDPADWDWTPDLVALDARGEPALVAVVRAWRGFEPDIERAYLAKMTAPPPPAPFGMFADLGRIRIFRTADPGSAVDLASAEVLRAYDPAFPEGATYSPYVADLVSAWLKDLDRHWRSARPPGADRVEAIGLLGRLRGGEVRREVGDAAHPLR